MLFIHVLTLLPILISFFLQLGWAGQAAAVVENHGADIVFAIRKAFHLTNTFDSAAFPNTGPGYTIVFDLCKEIQILRHSRGDGASPGGEARPELVSRSFL